MKKIVLSASFLLAFGWSIAQSNFDASNLRFGLQLSPTFSWMQSDLSEVNRNGVNLGLKLAMMGEYYFAENYAFTSGLGFAFNHGGTLRHDPVGEYWKTGESLQFADLKYSVQYIEIPLGLKMRTKEFGYIRYYGEPFVMLGFRSQARGDIKDTEFNDIDIQEYVTGAGLSWGIGVGIEYSISDSSALIGGLYFQNMFTDMTKEDTSNTVNDGSANFDALTIRLGILF